MARVKGKKKFSIKFELSPAGLLGVGLVCFCIFLWMFLLGVWAGQTVLTTGRYQLPELGRIKTTVARPSAKKKAAAESPAPKVPAEKAVEEDTGVPTVARQEKSPPAPPAAPALAGEDDTSYFAVQVGAFRENSHAGESLKKWRAKGYEAFSRPPEGPDDRYTRVYVGRFEEVAEARKQAETLEQKEKIKPFIAMIPAGSGNRP